MHIKGGSKQTKNHRAIALRNKSAPLFHRKSTASSTVGTIHATVEWNRPLLMQSCAMSVYDIGTQAMSA
jgi:hypothetical protein